MSKFVFPVTKRKKNYNSSQKIKEVTLIALAYTMIMISAFITAYQLWYNIVTSLKNDDCLSLLYQTHDDHSWPHLLESQTLSSDIIFTPMSQIPIKLPISTICLFTVLIHFNLGKYFMGTLYFSDYNSLIMNTDIQPLCPNTQNAPIICTTQVYLYLPISLSGTHALILFFPPSQKQSLAKTLCSFPSQVLQY